jgi:transcriptional antiterminator RfaH
VSIDLFESQDPFWFCIKTKPRQESAAKRSLIRDVGLEVFCPMLRFERARRSGKVKVTEAMFPGYIFAHFGYREKYRHVAASIGVSHIVKFGGVASIVSDSIIHELRAAVVDEETVEIKSSIEPGQEVKLLQGPFAGIRAVVTQVMPAQQRVKVLLELLGMEREVLVDEGGVLPDVAHPLAPR